MISSILTIYGGLIFVQEDNNLSFLRVTIFIGIVIANLRFILMWIFLAATVYKRYKYFDRFLYWMKKVPSKFDIAWFCRSTHLFKTFLVSINRQHGWFWPSLLLCYPEIAQSTVPHPRTKSSIGYSDFCHAHAYLLQVLIKCGTLCWLVP